ncbi:MAG: hypothetical protein FJ225_12335 [Lentisphaerae bacterium]|nr:hypothetical protein [Lentisphaerota bacterium]
MSERDSRHRAFLLLGPTGAGKTPLGDLLARRGFAGRRCFHFDFGAQLRAVGASGAPPAGFPAADVAVVRRALAEGRLLENDTFHVAERILRAFIAACGARPEDAIVMNGLPRHAGQAAGVDRLLRVETVVLLDCGPDVAAARIALDSGGDRGGRTDDSPAGIGRRIALFQARTPPLLDHYRAKGVRIIPISVTVPMKAEDMLAVLETAGGRQSCPCA